jgi:hypothetical protein
VDESVAKVEKNVVRDKAKTKVGSWENDQEEEFG